MKTDDRYLLENNFPLTYRENIAKEVFGVLEKCESFSFIGMEDNAKINFLRFVSTRGDVQKKYLNKKSGQFLFVMVDLNELMEISITGFYHLLGLSIIETLKSNKLSYSFLNNIFIDSPVILLKSLKEDISQVIRYTGKNIVIIFNEFDIVEKYLNIEMILRNLTSLRNSARFKISYIFACLKPFKYTSPLNQKTIWCPPFQSEDAIGVVERNEKRYGVKLTKKQEDEVVRLSGGHAGLIKFIVQVLSQNAKNVDKTLYSLNKESDICFQCERILAPLSEIEKIKLKTNEADPLLINMGFQTNEKNTHVFSPLLEMHILSGNCPIKPFVYDKENDEIYFKGEAIKKNLTLKETNLLKILIEKEGKIFRRDDIIEAIWDENNIPSDWTFDKLVSRLRKKIKDIKQDYLKTVKGVGLLLNNSI